METPPREVQHQHIFSIMLDIMSQKLLLEYEVDSYMELFGKGASADELKVEVQLGNIGAVLYHTMVHNPSDDHDQSFDEIGTSVLELEKMLRAELNISYRKRTPLQQLRLAVSQYDPYGN